MMHMNRIQGLTGATLVAALTLTACGTRTGGAASSPESPEAPESSASAESPGSDSATGTANTSPSQAGGGAANRRAPEDQGPDAAGRQTIVFDRVPGSKRASCVQVGDQRDVQSGGFVAGAWDEARKGYGEPGPGRSARQVRVYWVPMHTKPMPGLKVVATRAGDGERVTVRQKRVADADRWQFYDTVFTLPSGGTWTFRASAGQDAGCFVATFG